MNHPPHDQYPNRRVYFNPTTIPFGHDSASPNAHLPHVTTRTPLQQSHSTQSHSGTEFSSILGSINHDILDHFQIQLFQTLQRANDHAVHSYFSKKSAAI